MIGITNQRAKRLWQQEFDRQLQVLEKPFSYKTFVLLNKQFREASSFVNQGMTDGMSISHAVDKTEFNLQILFKEHYKRVGTTFSNKAFKILESSKFVKPSEIKTPLDEFWAEFDRWSKTEAATKIRRIQNTTKKTIASIITTGMKEGESHKDIAKRIQKSAPVINRFRATNISRTETHTAGVRSVDSAVKSTRIEMEKEWVSARDERTRTRDQGSQFEHFKAFPAGPDGERVKQNEKFQGTGEPMDYPGDSKGSAGNVVNCRCVLLYHPVSRERLPKPYEPPPSPVLEFEQMSIKEFNVSADFGLATGTKLKKELQEHLSGVFDRCPNLKTRAIGTEVRRPVPLKVDVTKGKVYGVGRESEGLYQKSWMRINGNTSSKETLSVGKSAYHIGEDKYSIMRHEYGHYANDELLTYSEQQEWTKLYLSLNKKEYKFFKKNVSEYAATNGSEAFAECFSAFTSPKYKMGMLPKEIEDYFVKVVGVTKRGKVPVKPVVSWEPAKTLDELSDKFKKINLGYPSFVDYDKTNSLILGNKVGEHFNEVFDKFPLLKDKVQKEQQLFDFYFYKGTSISYKDKTFVWGEYSHSKFKIKVAGSRPTQHTLNLSKNSYNAGTDLFSVCRHEYGHHVWDSVLRSDKFEFVEIWKEKGKEYFSKNVSRYAATNMSEAFSECFSSYTSPKYKIGMLPKDIEDYFIKIVGKGK